MKLLKKYSIKYTKEAKRKIGKLDPSIRAIIKKAIESLSSNPYKGKPLSYELAGLYSLRTSDYRIIYRIKEKQLIIIVISVGHRKEIYKRLKEVMSKD
jgi:mRNA interferase RelE/StbE